MHFTPEANMHQRLWRQLPDGRSTVETVSRAAEILLGQYME